MLSRQIEGGGTLRDQALSLAAQGRAVPENLRSLPFPEGLEYLWGWFSELQTARTSNGFGVNPITYGELQAWSHMTARDLDAWEVQLLKDLDLRYLASSAEVSAESNKRRENGRR